MSAAFRGRHPIRRPDMKRTAPAKPATAKLNLTVKSAGSLGHSFATPGMFFDKR